MTYRITSKTGADHGVYSGETPAEALLAMHRDAGYSPDRVWLGENGDVAFANLGLRHMSGGVNDWVIEEAKDVLCPKCGKVNKLAHEDGAVDGPRAYHAACWIAMSDDEQTAAWADIDEIQTAAD